MILVKIPLNQYKLIAIFIFTYILGCNLVKGQEPCAVPSTSAAINMKQPNGDNIKLKLIGNPFLSHHETEDGYTVVKDKTDQFYKYAELEYTGALKPTSVIARNAETRTAQELLFLKQKSKHLNYTGESRRNRLQAQKKFYEQKEIKSNSGKQISAIIKKSNPIGSGTFKHLVLLIDFQDYPFSNSRADFDDMLNQIGYTGNGQRGSFKDYYLDTSYGNLSVETTVVGWYTAQHDISYYGYNENLPFPFNAPELVREAVDAAEAAGVDFSQFDNDGDGDCDLVTIGHAGPGAETVGYESQYIWSHKSGLGNARKVTYDGVEINQYTMNPETPGGETNKRLTDIGIYVHEFGHALGLPDLYEFETSNGAGRWCSMSWSSNQRSPIEFNPHFKEKLGWMTPIVLEGTGTVTNMPSTNDSPTYYRINTPYPWEYYLLANMQKTEWNSQIPNSGLMIWHIDSSQRNNTNVSSLHVVPEQADGRQDLQQPPPGGNYWDGGDPYPGTSGNTSFNTSSNPNSNLNDGTVVDMSITNINEESGLISFNYSDASTKQNQTISFDAISDKVFGDSVFGLVANTTSGLNSTFSVIEGPITITNGIVNITGAGMASVAANQSGNSDYNSAAEVVRTFMIEKAEQQISITGIDDKMSGDLPFEIVATVNSGLTLSYQVEGPASLTGNTVTLTGVSGTVTVTAEQIGDANHNPVSQSTSFNVVGEKADQTITFEALENKVFGSSDFELFATTTSGLEVAFAVREGPIQLNGTTISIMGTGTAIIAANQAGNNTYNPANEVLRTIVIEKAEQHITIISIDYKLTTDEPFELLASVDSGMPLEFQINGPATLSGTTISLEGLMGNVTGTVYQSGNENYHATEKSFSFEVAQSTNPISVEFYPNPIQNYLTINSEHPIFLRIYNLEGKLINSFFGLKNDQIDFSTYAKGTYVLEYKTNEGNITHEKIIKK